MTYRQDILNELLALRRETVHSLGSHSDEWREGSHQKINNAATDVKTMISDFCEVIALEEKDIERALEGKVATALTTALMVGIVIGWAWRKKS